MKTFLNMVWMSLLLSVNSFGQGTILWDESVNGPISHDFSNPTVLGLLGNSTNSLIGTTEVVRNGNIWVSQGDYFTFEVPPNSSLAAVFISVDKPNVWAWLGNPAFSAEFGFVQNSMSGELLQQWALTPVSSGSYGMYLLNADHSSDMSIASYRLDFFVQAVPEPSVLSLLLSGGLLVLFRGWRKRRIALSRSWSLIRKSPFAERLHDGAAHIFQSLAQHVST